MSMIRINPLLLDLAKTNTGLSKNAFIPAGQAGGDPSQGGAPPPGGDPSQGGAPPLGGDPSAGGAPPPSGGDPAAGGAPPPGGDPSGGGGGPPTGSPPPEMMQMIGQVVSQAVSQAMQMQGGQPGAPGAGGPKKSKGGDEVALQLYKTNVFLMAIITAMNKGGLQVEIPPEAMLGPPPGTDPAMAGQSGAATQGNPGVTAPGADPNAAGGQDPNAAPQQQQIPFAPAIASKTAEATDFDEEEAALAMGIPYPARDTSDPIPAAMQELFGVPGTKQAQAAPVIGVQDRASAVFHMISAARQQRPAIQQ